MVQPQYKNKYATIQIPREIKEQMVDYCNRKDLRLGKFISRLFLQEVSGSYTGSL